MSDAKKRLQCKNWILTADTLGTLSMLQTVL